MPSRELTCRPPEKGHCSGYPGRLDVSGFLHRNKYLKGKGEGDVSGAAGVTTGARGSGTSGKRKERLQRYRRVRSVGEVVDRCTWS